MRDWLLEVMTSQLSLLIGRHVTASQRIDRLVYSLDQFAEATPTVGREEAETSPQLQAEEGQRSTSEMEKCYRRLLREMLDALLPRR